MTLTKYYRKWVTTWKELWSNRSYRLSFYSGWSLLFIALFVNFKAVLYTDKIPVLSVGDLILDNIPTINLTYIYTYGYFLIILLVIIYPVFFKPEILPFSAKTIAAFIIIRGFFISLTHLGAPENFFALPQLDDQEGINKLFFMNDLFFSGHAGFPFLAALLFWEDTFMRWTMLIFSFVQAATVLFMHVHYSIDVFSAYFITYTIYVISEKIFRGMNSSFRKIVKTVEKAEEAVVEGLTK